MEDISIITDTSIENIDGERGEADIILHPENVKQRQDVYSSLTDLNEIDVFSTQFQDIVEQVLGERQQREEEISEEIFVKETDEQQDADAQLVGQLFLRQEEVILTPEYSSDTASWSFTNVGLVLITALAVSALYIFLFENRKVKRG